MDSIRALFSEKEKELSLAVAKVEALTRQLEELRRDRRGLNLLTGNGNNQQPQTPAARELEKLRRELMVSCFIFNTRSLLFVPGVSISHCFIHNSFLNLFCTVSQSIVTSTRCQTSFATRSITAETGRIEIGGSTNIRIAG